MTRQPAMLALVTDAFGGRGGIAQYNRDFLSAVAASNTFARIAVAPRHAPDPVETPKAIVQLPARPGRIGYAVAAIRAALSRQVDVVFCGHLFMAPLAALIARLKGAKLVLQTHGIEAWPRPSNLCRKAADSASLILCVSRYTRGAVLNWATISPERVLVLPNTVGDAFAPGDSGKLRSELGLEGRQALLTVGRLSSQEQYKGHDRIIAAIPQLVGEGIDLVYLIVGEGDDRARLEQLAKTAGCADRVRLLGGVTLERLIEMYRVADLFVMPSTGEGFGIAYLEAMASGTPALGLDVAGAKDALADGGLGYCVAEGELAAAIGRALRAPVRDKTKLAEAVTARFGRARFMSSTEAAVHRLLEAA